MPLDVVSPHILTAEDFYHPHPQHPEHSAPEAVVFRFWRHDNGPQRGHMKGPWPTDVVDSPVALAHVNHGRWMARCPFEACASAQYVSKSERRFFCVHCDSGGTGAWIRVAWPGELEVTAIEAALGVRPQASTRNWEPAAMRAAYGLAPETVADLERENRERGVA